MLATVYKNTQFSFKASTKEVFIFRFRSEQQVYCPTDKYHY
jgi:hypothetical protein